MEGLHDFSLKVRLKCIIIVLLSSVLLSVHAQNAEEDEGVEAEKRTLLPTVMIAILVRNKAHVLPYSLHYLENLDYPKNRTTIWIRSDHNRDNSTAILQAWVENVRSQYHHIDFLADDSAEGYTDAKGPCDWSHLRFMHIINMRQSALDAARHYWADYLLMLDADVILYNRLTLRNLIKVDRTIVAPMLNVTANDYYSNFWGGMDEQGYYMRSDDYFPILHRQIESYFPVAMVHTALLINLRHERSQNLAYKPVPPNYTGPLDDIIIFAHSARHYDVAMYILNDDFYGYITVPMEGHNNLEQERDQFSHVLLENIVYDTPLQRLPYIPVVMKEPSLLGFDQIYMINLKRRTDRREKMLNCLAELGIQAQVFDAVDGRELNDTYLDQLGVKMLEGYTDPYLGRPITFGEIGCFLSHYFIWQDMVRNGYEKIIIFEDDIRFEPHFNQKLRYLMHQIDTLHVDWDLTYLGRKRMNAQDEVWVTGAENLVWADYSYWTLSYMLTYRGATKLLEQEPLGKIIPVDEYLPIMFDRHPTDSWKLAYFPRNLRGFSSQPLLVYPTHYTGEPGYFTDTEESVAINQAVRGKGDDGDLDEALAEMELKAGHSLESDLRDEL